MHFDELREQLSADLRDAMKRRAPVEVSLLRSLLGSLDNATAPASPAPEGPLLPSGEVPRREPTPGDVTAIIEQEVAERTVALNEYLRLGRESEVLRLQQELTMLNRYR